MSAEGCFCDQMRAEGYREVCPWCISNKDHSRGPTPLEIAAAKRRDGPCPHCGMVFATDYSAITHDCLSKPGYVMNNRSPVMNPTPPTIDDPERREAVARLIDPAWWTWFDRHGDLSIKSDKRRHDFLFERADAVLTLLAASSGGAGAALWPTVVSVHADRVRGTETIIRLREALGNAARQFRFYERSHKQKGTPDGDEKANTNAEFALMCENALAEKHPLTKAESIAALATPATVGERKV